MQRAQQVLETTFGYSEFRTSQKAIIQQIIDGHDALVLMPTGGGKSLCYQIPALIRNGIGIIVSPLIALMQDQVDAMRQLGVRAAYLNSTLTFKQVMEVESLCKNQELDLLYIAPERLLSDSMLHFLEQLPLALFAIDEAHCVSQWGHDFRPEYQKLSILHQRFPHVPRIALTATADSRTRSEIILQLQLQQAEVYISSFDRPNISYTLAEANNAKQQLWRFLKAEHPSDSGIVYCLSRKRVEQIADWLSDQGRTALPYHAGLRADVRQQNQQRFLREENIIIVATIAFGMGIDKPDVRFVAHLNLPKSVEAYYQETGRAGRDGEPADAWMVYGLQDVITLRQFVQSSEANDTQKQVEHHKLESMLALCEETGCRRHALLAYFDEQGEKKCGNCDNCISPPQTWLATEAARMALSCVYRTGQRFGVNYVSQVLQGKSDQRIEDNGHDKVTTFGIGSATSTNEWRSIFRQLIARGYLYVDLNQHGAVQLTSQCRPLLRGEEPIYLRKYSAEKSTTKKSSKEQKVRPQEIVLWDALRALRLSIAEKDSVPSFVVFHDSTLLEMVRSRPNTREKMQQISGIGETKLNRYGAQFLAVIIEHPLPEMLNNRLSDTVNQTLMLYAEKKSIEAIAAERELNVGRIYSHLAEAIESGLLSAKEVLQLDDDEFNDIVNEFELLAEDEKSRLKPVHEALNGAYEYDILRCVQASLG